MSGTRFSCCTIPANFIEKYSTAGATDDEDSQGTQMSNVNAILDSNNQFFRLDTKGNLQVYNASISNLVANKISTKSIWINGREYSYRKKKTLVNVSVGTASQTITMYVPPIGVNRSAMTVTDSMGGSCTVRGLVKTNGQTITTTASLTTVKGKTSTIYYLGTG